MSPSSPSWFRPDLEVLSQRGIRGGEHSQRPQGGQEACWILSAPDDDDEDEDDPDDGGDYEDDDDVDDDLDMGNDIDDDDTDNVNNNINCNSEDDASQEWKKIMMCKNIKVESEIVSRQWKAFLENVKHFKLCSRENMYFPTRNWISIKSCF